jgi:hypothetical protein
VNVHQKREQKSSSRYNQRRVCIRNKVALVVELKPQTRFCGKVCNFGFVLPSTGKVGTMTPSTADRDGGENETAGHNGATARKV